ncbi:hypothetical protein P691DRAFT_762655 [Macrolepiota fuliginosa MF-IS2]|uniref:Uncharacterized protein n=1 Tax=Macrolepiota fuliginosa MF-IS2 TaxID=1400762 RepID=A0A9P6BYK3_9AGAR|nr:hypothetical protein P691DRAFT_762655 [Macrolepiota fuliginosa MF-IS2]
MAILLATPGLYRSFIEEWNVHHPEHAFVPQTGEVRHYRQLVLAPGTGANLTIDTITEVLIHNGVPPAEVDHAYTFGVNYMNQIYVDDPLHWSLFDKADELHLEALQLHGVPPAIPELNSWILPTKINLICMYYFKGRTCNEEHHEIMDAPRWRIVGAPIHPFILTRRVYLGVEQQRERARTAPGTATSMLAAPGPLDALPAPPPIVDEGTSTAATQMQQESTAMAVDLLNYSSADPSGPPANTSMAETSGGNHPSINSTLHPEEQLPSA